MVRQVRVSSGAGEPVSGAAVHWTVDGEGELPGGETITTDADGRAAQRVLLTSGPGRFAVRASDGTGDRRIVFQLAVDSSPG